LLLVACQRPVAACELLVVAWCQRLAVAYHLFVGRVCYDSQSAGQIAAERWESNAFSVQLVEVEWPFAFDRLTAADV
jgi:hypothetical protein